MADLLNRLSMDDAWAHLPNTHYVDNRIYCTPEIFELEQAKIFSRVWKFVCCESELVSKYDFRTTVVAGVPLILVRGADSEIRAFVNSCSHRGVKLVDVPAGNTRWFECIFHRWSYDTRGSCVDIPRDFAYKNVGLDKGQCGLKQVRCDRVHGLVFVNLDKGAKPLEEYLGGCLAEFADVFQQSELEVFHFHEQIVESDWKHWQETNMELYHEYLHVLNRKTGMLDPSYFCRKWRKFPNGHAAIEPLIVDYEKMPGMSSRAEWSLPGLRPNEFRLLDIFPDVMINCRASVIRMDTQIPLGPGKTLVQFRGLGVKGEPDEVRRFRIKDHAEFWGPFGRNLPEDTLAVERQHRAGPGGSTFSLIAREEDRQTQDDFPTREFFREWEHLMGICASHPFEPSRGLPK